MPLPCTRGCNRRWISSEPRDDLGIITPIPGGLRAWGAAEGSPGDKEPWLSQRQCAVWGQSCSRLSPGNPLGGCAPAERWFIMEPLGTRDGSPASVAPCLMLCGLQDSLGSNLSSAPHKNVWEHCAVCCEVNDRRRLKSLAPGWQPVRAPCSTWGAPASTIHAAVYSCDTYRLASIVYLALSWVLKAALTEWLRSGSGELD